MVVSALPPDRQAISTTDVWHISLTCIYDAAIYIHVVTASGITATVGPGTPRPKFGPLCQQTDVCVARLAGE